MSKPRLHVVPDEPQTMLERYAAMADEEYARAQALSKQVAQLMEVQGEHRLLLAASWAVLVADDEDDEALRDEAMARLREVIYAISS